MSLGPVMVDLVGTTISAKERQLLQNPVVGGVILFTRNYESVEQLRALCAEIHALREPRLLISVDHEGGRVQRFKPGFTHLPPAAVLGRLYDASGKQVALNAAEQLGWLMAAELVHYGVDFSFAPVLDMDYGVSGVIGDRAFHKDPQVIAQLCQAWVRGMAKAGMAAVGKHFPGHGAVKEDSHTEKPVDQRELADLMLADVVPFQRLIDNGLAAVMPAHVLYAKVDDKPAGYSARWLQDILRNELGFQGVIFSDDLSMEGGNLGASFAERAQQALQAGCDMVLVCNHPAAAEEVVQALADYQEPASSLRLTRMHSKPGMLATDLFAQDQWRAAKQLVDDLSTQQNLELNI